MSDFARFPQTRMRRLRQKNGMRDLVRENRVHLNKLVLPLFIRHGKGVKNPIHSMPSHYQLSVDQLEPEIKQIVSLGIKSVILFGIPPAKDRLGQEAYADDGIIQSAIPVIKDIAPELLVMTDTCLCEYTDHGHCGVITEQNCLKEVHNDETLALLAKQAVSHARAGADVIAPSGCMDGMVHTIRRALDENGFHDLPILSYSAKYASNLYSPFREAAEGAPQFGDRHSYQMDFANSHEALRECALDIAEGADMLMVKPAHTYLDVILRVKEAYPALPLCAFHTSGEYAILKAAAQKGWIDERSSVLEVTTGIFRAGADFIITYFAKDMADWIA